MATGIVKKGGAAGNPPMFTKAAEGGKGAIRAVLSIAVALLFIFLAFRYAPRLPDLGVGVTSTPLSVPSFFAGIFNVFGIGDGSSATAEALIVFIAIFLIIFFGVSDILEMFSTFSRTTAWIIGFGIALIAGVTKVISAMIVIFGFTAGIGALGLMLVIFGSIAAAVTLNLGIGGWTRKWRLMRQMEIESMKSAQGANKVTNFIRAAKKIDEELEN